MHSLMHHLADSLTLWHNRGKINMREENLGESKVRSFLTNKWQRVSKHDGRHTHIHLIQSVSQWCLSRLQMLKKIAHNALDDVHM